MYHVRIAVALVKLREQLILVTQLPCLTDNITFVLIGVERNFYQNLPAGQLLVAVALLQAKVLVSERVLQWLEPALARH